MTDRTTPAVLLGIDYGTKRTGLAIARAGVRISQPLTTVAGGEQSLAAVQAVIRQEQVTELVVGLPRGMAGQSTDQTRLAETFARELATATALPLHMQDEALTSQKAEAELQRRGQPFAKADVDSLAAAYILQDYLELAHV